MQIIRRSRLGNDTEDITFIPGRPGNIAIMDGYDVLSVPASTTPRPPGIIPPIPPPVMSDTLATGVATAASKPIPGPSPLPVPRLFDVLGLGVKAAPRGIAYDPVRRGFVFSDTTQVATLFLTDSRGLPQQTITIQYPGDQPLGVEALALIPANAPEFANAIVLVASVNSDDSVSQLEIIDSSGAVLREIVPQGALADLFITGVTFRSPGSLLVSSDDDETVFEIDFNGNTIATFVGTPPSETPVIHGIEGLYEISNQQTVAAGLADGLLAFFDVRAGITKKQVVDYRIGLGLTRPTGLAWDSTNNRFLLVSIDRQQDLNSSISGVVPRLDSFQSVVQVDELSRKITYLPDDQLIAATHANNPRGILFFDQQGQASGQIDTQALGNPVVISYIPSTSEFAVVFSNQRTKLSVLTRKGALSRVIDLVPAGVGRINAATFFNPSHRSGGQFLIVDSNNNTGVITDFMGTQLDKFDIRATLRLLSPSAVTAITTGPDAGAFAVADADNSEVVVFRLD